MSAEKARLDALRIDRPAETPGARPWLWPALVLLLAALAAGGWWLSRPAVAEVRTVAAREVPAGSAATVLNASGYVTARRQATVSSKVTGKVLEVLIEEGMEVTEGQVLARLDDSNTRAGLRLAEAQARVAESALEETEVRLDEARLDLRRAEELVAGQVASQADLDRARAEVDSLVARLARQREDAEVARRQVAVWRQQMEDLVIRAPFTGVIVSKNAQPGEMISPNSAGGGFTRTGIGTVVDMDSLEIEVDVNEAYINRVSAGQPVDATLDSYPDWKIPCRVIAIIPTADRQRATVEVRIGFDQIDPRILPDMGVKVAFQDEGTAAGQAHATRVVVPKSALRGDSGTDRVLVVDDGVVERRAVEVGEVRDEEATVIAGLAAGERVVVEGPAELAEGDRVKEKTG